VRTARAERPSPLLLIGAVRGLEEEGEGVERELTSFAPQTVLLGLSPEEVHALSEHFLPQGCEPWVPLSKAEMAYARGLSRFGRVRLPSPSFVAALRWADAHGATVEGVEPSDDSYSALFVQHLGYFDLLRRTLGERSLTNDPPNADDAETYAEQWEARSEKGAGSRRLSEARARHVSEELRRFRGTPLKDTSASASLKNRSALVVDVERFRPLRHALAGAGWKPLREDPHPARPDRPDPEHSSGAPTSPSARP
jgi:hypothetical protein